MAFNDSKMEICDLNTNIKLTEKLTFWKALVQLQLVLWDFEVSFKQQAYDDHWRVSKNTHWREVEVYPKVIQL